jgi:dienelactone hydrolase
MADVVLFHSALGFNQAVDLFATFLREDGHRVITPDLFEGETFTEISRGIAKRDAIGLPVLMERALAAASQAPAGSVMAGFSMGAAAAAYVATKRADTKGLVLMHSAPPLTRLGLAAWPPGLSVQLHVGTADPYIDPAAVDALVRVTNAEIFRYEGAGHLFGDPSQTEYEPVAAELMRERVRGFVRALTVTG